MAQEGLGPPEGQRGRSTRGGAGVAPGPHRGVGDGRLPDCPLTSRRAGERGCGQPAPRGRRSCAADSGPFGGWRSQARGTRAPDRTVLSAAQLFRARARERVHRVCSWLAPASVPRGMGPSCVPRTCLVTTMTLSGGELYVQPSGRGQAIQGEEGRGMEMWEAWKGFRDPPQREPL